MISKEATLPIFDESDRRLFKIEDSRQRMDQLQRLILPRIKPILGRSIDVIKEIYGIDALNDSTDSKGPAHRKDATQPIDYTHAHHGLAPKRTYSLKGYRKPNGEPVRFAGFRLGIELNEDGLCPSLYVSRRSEGETLFDLLKLHEDDAVWLIDFFGCEIWSEQQFPQEMGEREKIRATIIPRDGLRWRNGVIGDIVDYPIVDGQPIWKVILQFSSLFPIYQAMVDLYLGRDERFRDYFALFRKRYSSARGLVLASGRPEADPPGKRGPPTRAGTLQPASAQEHFEESESEGEQGSGTDSESSARGQWFDDEVRESAVAANAWGVAPDQFNPDDLEEGRERIAASVAARQGQGEFREILIRAYKSRCAVTGCDVECVLQAAHLYPHTGPKSNHCSNGIILRADIHNLFDKHMIAINPQLKIIRIASALKDTSYAQLDGRTPTLPDNPSESPHKKALQYRFEMFNEREQAEG